MTPEMGILDRTVEIPGHTNLIWSKIGYYSEMLHNIHHGRGIEFCTILFDKRLTFSAD